MKPETVAYMLTLQGYLCLALAQRVRGLEASALAFEREFWLAVYWHNAGVYAGAQRGKLRLLHKRPA